MSVIKARKTPEDNASWDHVEAIGGERDQEIKRRLHEVIERRGRMLDEWNEKLVSLRAQAERLSAPVSDEEMGGGNGLLISPRKKFDAIIAARKAK